MTATTSGPGRPVALVTGASRGIGRAIVLALTDCGFLTAGLSRPPAAGAADADAAARLEAEVVARHGRYLPLFADVADLDAHEGIIDSVFNTFGRLDVFVSNAGVAPSPRRDILEMTPESYDRVMGINLRGSLFLAQKAARAMLAHPPADGAETHRSLVFVSSVSATASSPERAEYCLSKAGVSMAARILADRLASSGITVFEVRPGIIRTDMTAPVQEKYDRRIAEGLVPQGRWGEPEDVARVVSALARGDFRYSTGAIIDVGGGLGLPRL